MPIYEYGCPTCGHQFEKLQKVGADAPPCPECGAEDVRKKVSASAFVLKGSGWYKDHYGLKSSGPSGTSGGSDGGSSSSEGGSSSSSSESSSSSSASSDS